MATLRAPNDSGDGPTRPPARLINPRVEDFCEPREVTSLEEAELLAEARFGEEMDTYHNANAHRLREIVVPIVDAEGYDDEVTTTGNLAYSGLNLQESRALLLNLAPVFADRRAFEQAMRGGMPCVPRSPTAGRLGGRAVLDVRSPSRTSGPQ
jgi:hypothetical protein